MIVRITSWFRGKGNAIAEMPASLIASTCGLLDGHSIFLPAQHIDRVWFLPTIFRRIHHALSARASGFEEYARLPRLNECLSTSKSRQGVTPGFSTRNIVAEFTRNDKRVLQCQ